MFTGIIEAFGKVRKAAGSELWINTSLVARSRPGQSIAVNGACLTIVEKDRRGFRVELLEETRRLTNLGVLKIGSVVNLERAMKFGDRLDGHIVQGHVEEVATITKISIAKNSKSEILNPRQIQNSKCKIQKNTDCVMNIKVPRKLLKYMILKGIVILDGIALTITKLDDRKSEIEVAITAYTWENTNLHGRHVGNFVNVETDVVGKWVERFMRNH